MLERSDTVWFERWERNQGMLRCGRAIEELKGGGLWPSTIEPHYPLPDWTSARNSPCFHEPAVNPAIEKI